MLKPDPLRPPAPGRPTWTLAALVSGLVLGLVVLPPLVPDGPRMALYAAFSTVCHQLDARSFHLHGHAFAVCHRCTGIFAGLFVGTLLWPLARRHEAWLLHRAGPLLALSLMPAAVDWSLGASGLWPNTPVSRALTGVLFGAVAGVYLARGFARLVTPAPRRPELDLSHPSHPPG